MARQRGPRARMLTEDPHAATRMRVLASLLTQGLLGQLMVFAVRPDPAVGKSIAATALMLAGCVLSGLRDPLTQPRYVIGLVLVFVGGVANIAVLLGLT